MKVLSLGGAHSNHLHALAYACMERGIPSIGLVSSSAAGLSSPTLLDCGKWGMRLIALSSAQTTHFKADPHGLCDELGLGTDRLRIIPMGGDSPEGQKGIAEMVQEVERECPGRPLEWVLPLGTGCTAEAVIHHSSTAGLFTLYLPFKKERIRRHLIKRIEAIDAPAPIRWLPPPARPFGRQDAVILDRLRHFQKQTGLLMDPLYNGPMLLKWLELQSPGMSGEMDTVVYHSGGLQGWKGFGDR